MRIAVATASVAFTMTGPSVFGRMWRNMIRRSPAPAAFAASTYSFSRSERKMPAHDARERRPEEEREDERDAPLVALPEQRGGGEQHDEQRQREHEVGEAHQEVVDPAAVVAGDGADEEADDRRDDRDGDADLLEVRIP